MIREAVQNSLSGSVAPSAVGRGPGPDADGEADHQEHDAEAQLAVAPPLGHASHWSIPAKRSCVS